MIIKHISWVRQIILIQNQYWLISQIYFLANLFNEYFSKYYSAYIMLQNLNNLT
jgi:hypothetical protein